MYGPAGAFVLGGQISVYRDASGAVRTVIGSHYPAIAPRNSVRLSRAAAFRRPPATSARRGKRTARVMIDPESGRYFYRVETQRVAKRWIHWIDAANGKVLAKIDAIQDDHGTA